MHQLLAGLPAGLIAVPDCDVVLVAEPLTVRAPDLLVAADSIMRAGHHVVASEVLAAVEIRDTGVVEVGGAVVPIDVTSLLTR